MKLYATLETSTGKKVSISDNDEIIATVYEKNLKCYQVIISWQNLGDLENTKMGAVVSSREWRNREEERRK